jgi:hypothetical protein
MRATANSLDVFVVRGMEDRMDKTEQDRIEWFQRMGKSFGWPNWGHWMIAPDDDQDADEGNWILLHGETRSRIPFVMDDGATLEDEAAFFGKVFPGAEVRAPAIHTHNVLLCAERK